MILEGGIQNRLALGVVFEDFKYQFPGLGQGTVGYHTNEKRIHDGEEHDEGKKTAGIVSGIVFIYYVHLQTTATSLKRPCFPVPTSDPFTKILLLKTSPQRPRPNNGQKILSEGGCCREVRLY